MMKKLLLAMVLFLASVSCAPVNAATCTGDANCRVCKNCEHCAFCSKNGGRCGVCDGGLKSSVKSRAKSVRKTAVKSKIRTTRVQLNRFSASQKPTTPKAGSPERKAILDALRKPVEKDMKQKVIFYDVQIKVKKGWAYVSAMGRDAKGNKMKAWDEHADPTTTGLLKMRGKSWTVLYWGAGTGMDPVSEARLKFPQAPKSIFPSMPDDFPGDGPYGGSGYNNRD